MLLYGVLIFQPQRFNQVRRELLKFWGGYISHNMSYHYYYYNNYLQEPHKVLELHSQAADFTHTGCTKQERSVSSVRRLEKTT
jgi:hypothetical protein